MGAIAADAAATLSPTSSKVRAAGPPLPLERVAAGGNGGPNTLFLDGLRGLAALYVLMRHVTWVPAPTSTRPMWLHVLNALRHAFLYGHMAVVFFFVLSGFVIHLRFAKQLRKDPNTATFNWGQFVFRRARRLYPPLIAAILITTFVDYLGKRMGHTEFYATGGDDFAWIPEAIRDNHTTKTLLGNLTFLMQMHVPVWGTDNPLWSLAYEWWFYMLYPLLWMVSRRSIRLATLVVIVLFLFTAVDPYLAHVPNHQPGISGFLKWMFSGQFPQVQDRPYEFTGWYTLSMPRRVLAALPTWWCGVLLADVYAGRIRISFKWLMPLSLALGLLFLKITKGQPEVVRNLMAAVGFCGLISTCFVLQQWNVKLTVLNKLKVLGDFSYTLYVTHWPLVIFLTPILVNHIAGHMPLSGPVSLLILAGVPIAVAWFVHLIAEKPFTTGPKSKGSPAPARNVPQPAGATA